MHKFYVDYSVPAGDNVFDPAAFEKFLHDRIKVDGKTGQFGDVIQINKEGEFWALELFSVVSSTSRCKAGELHNDGMGGHGKISAGMMSCVFSY